MRKHLCRAALAFLAAALVAGPALVMGANPVTVEQDWTWKQYYAASSAASSTHTTPSGAIGFSYMVRAVGADAQYTISHPTRTYTDSSVAASSVTTSLVTVPSGMTLSGTFEALTAEPWLTIHGLNTAATVQVWLNYGERKQR